MRANDHDCPERGPWEGAAASSAHVLRMQWVLMGLLYGVAVWAVMNLMLLPLTAVAPGPITTAALANGIVSHALFVGLPSALFAKKAAAA